MCPANCLKESSRRGKISHHHPEEVMTHEEISQNTKQAFAAALKELMKQKPLNKITVKDLTEACDVNRKTFYYHFTDIYDLLKWILDEEAVNIVKQFDLIVDFRDAVSFVLGYVEKNTHLLNCVYDSIGRDELKRFFYADFIQIVKDTVDRYEKELGLCLKQLYKEFVSIFYAEAIAGVLVSWIRDPKPADNETGIDYIDRLIMSSVPAVLMAGDKEV